MDEAKSAEGEIAKNDPPTEERSKSQNEVETKSESTSAQKIEGKTETKDINAQPVYNWCKIPCDPKDYGGRDHYYMHFLTQESRYDEPDEPYYLWNLETQSVDAAGLQQPSKTDEHVSLNLRINKSDVEKSEDKEEYWGYNPKIHGAYDPTAPYAAYHKRKQDEEEAAEQAALPGAAGIYESAAKFNRFTGAFQNPDQGSDRHSDAAKSHRQLSAFFDVDADANKHDGRSLKAERQQQKYSKKEIQEMVARRKAKKAEKRIAWLKN